MISWLTLRSICIKLTIFSAFAILPASNILAEEPWRLPPDRFSAAQDYENVLRLDNYVASTDKKGCKPACIESIQFEITNISGKNIIAIDAAILLSGRLGEEILIDTMIDRYSAWPAGSTKTFEYGGVYPRSGGKKIYDQSYMIGQFLFAPAEMHNAKVLVGQVVYDDK